MVCVHVGVGELVQASEEGMEAIVGEKCFSKGGGTFTDRPDGHLSPETVSR